MSDRDPRVDPKPGDELRGPYSIWPELRHQRLRVLRVCEIKRASFVLAQVNKHEEAYTIDDWRSWTQGAEVLHAAE